MAITDVKIRQNNITDGVNLISLNNPLVFLIDVTWNTALPLYLKVLLTAARLNDINTQTHVLNYKAIPYKDNGNVRTYIFSADKVCRSCMDSISDVLQSEGTFEYQEFFCKWFTIFFIDPDLSSQRQDVVQFKGFVGASQFGETLSQTALVNNETQTFIAAEGMPVYVYFYNDNENNVIDIVDVNLKYAVEDYDREFFTDFDGQIFTAKFDAPGSAPVLSCSEYGQLPISYFEEFEYPQTIYNCTFTDLES